MTKVGIERDQHPAVLEGKLAHRRVIGASQAYVDHRHRIVPRMTQPPRMRRRQVFVQQQLQALAKTTSSVANWEA